MRVLPQEVLEAELDKVLSIRRAYWFNQLLGTCRMLVDNRLGASRPIAEGPFVKHLPDRVEHLLALRSRQEQLIAGKV